MREDWARGHWTPYGPPGRTLAVRTDPVMPNWFFLVAPWRPLNDMSGQALMCWEKPSNARE